MRLGLSSPLKHNSPEEWADQMVKLGAGCVNFPITCEESTDKIMAYKEAADNAGLIIAEVGVWRNTLAADPDERRKCMDYAIGQLKMADMIGAKCCVNVAGTPCGPRWDGGYRGNFSKEIYDEIVKMIQEIIDTANPKNTVYSIESMPWMVPTGPDEYLKLIKDVNRKQFGTHLDIVNMITSPQRYFFNDEFIKECFEKLHGTIVSCHLKDVRLKEEYTFQLEETYCGNGGLDIKLFAELATKENPDMPMIIEHLTTDEEYIRDINYVRNLINM